MYARFSLPLLSGILIIFLSAIPKPVDQTLRKEEDIQDLQGNDDLLLSLIETEEKLEKKNHSAPNTSTCLGDSCLAQEELNPTFREFNELRSQGLREWEAFLAADHLAGFDKAEVVESVCGGIKVHEEKQMCRKRGRRIGETLLKHYSSLSMGLARQVQWATGLKYMLRITLRQGKVVGWHWGRGKRPYIRSPVEKLKAAFILAHLMGIVRQGKMHYNHTISIVTSMDDVCFEPKTSYPVTWFAAGATCPQVVPLSASYLQQMKGFVPKEPVREYKDLISKVFMRAAGYNAHRWDTYLLSGSGLLPWLDCKQVSTTSMAKYFQEKCWDSVTELKKTIKPPLYEGTGFPKEGQCSRNGANNVHAGMATYDEVIKHKYLLLVDGIVSTFRAGPQLQAPGVTMLLQQSHTNTSFNSDLIPYVHYLPIDEDRKNLPTSLNMTYLWAEKYAETTENIAKESTRWAKLHADDRAHSRDWELYGAFLAHMTPSDEVPSPKDIEFHPPPCPSNSSDFDSFFMEENPFDYQVGGYARPRLVNMACNDNLGL